MEHKNTTLCELNIDLALSNSPFFHSSRQAHENILEDLSKYLEYVNKSLRTCLEDSAGICTRRVLMFRS